MKTIKFRVWDDSNKRYFHTSQWRLSFDGKVIDKSNDEEWRMAPECKVEQFTGFQDSEGKDIYEGDIVIGLWDGELDYSSQKVKVEFKNGAFRENYFNRPIADYIQNYRCKIKIIGNTHEAYNGMYELIRHITKTEIEGVND